MTACHPPKCHKTRRRCQCPNPWIEFQARIASERRAKALKALSRSQMSRAYKREKAAGTFSKRPSEECRSDDVLLCSWNSDRVRAATGKSQVVKLPSLLTSYPIDERNNVPCDWRQESPRVIHGNFVQRWLPIVERMLPNFRFQFFAKGSREDDVLTLFRETKTGAYLLVRLVMGTRSPNKVPLPSMYGAQKVWEEKLGKNIPRIHFAYTVYSGQHSATIIGTDAVQGVLTDLLDVKQIRKSLDKEPLCTKLMALLRLLKREKLQHGDLHFSNISYRMSQSGKDIEYLGMIDFESAGPLVRQSEDFDPVITNVYRYKLLPYLKNNNIEYPSWFITAVQKKEDVYEAMARANPGKIQRSVNYRPPYPLLKMPEIHI